MTQNSTRSAILYKSLPLFKIKVLSVGKNKKDQSLNEDRWVITADTLAVIDGASARIPFLFGNKSGGQYAADIIKNTLENTKSSLNGIQLVKLITQEIENTLKKSGVYKFIQNTPEARPAALFTSLRFDRSKVVITSVGDVGCRINNKQLYQNHLKIDDVLSLKRVSAMKKAKLQYPNINDDDLQNIGRKVITDDLKKQAREYYNNPRNKYGHGIINGKKVPLKYISIYKIDLNLIKTIELFSDGYFLLGKKPTILSWENGFKKIEKEDPLKWKSVKAVKGSTKDTYTDDRTILIANVTSL